MEKLDDMQQKKAIDDELDQVHGGRNIFNIFTTEFFTPKHLDPFQEPRADSGSFGVSTLEMRAKPMKKRDTKESGKGIKL